MRKYFNNFNFYNKKSDENFHIIEKFQPVAQKLDNSCGPVCVKMVLEHYGEKINLTDEQLCDLFGTRPWPYGTKLKNMISGTKKLCKNRVISSLDGGGVERFKEYQDFKKFVLFWIDKKVPIIVENVDSGGHYRVIIWFDEDKTNQEEKDVLIFADPSDLYDGVNDGYNFCPAEKFFYMWFDAHCLETKARVQPYIIILPTNFAENKVGCSN